MSCFQIFMKNVRDFVLRFDLFAATPTLRVRGQASYESVGCGIISIIMVGTFIGIFAQQIIQVLNKTEVSASVNLDDLPQSAQNIDNIRFAIGVQLKTFSEMDGYVQFSLQTLTLQKGEPSMNKIQLVQCTQQIWNKYSNETAKYFKPMKIQEMYCIPPDANISLYGYEGSQDSNILKLTVSKCDGRDSNSSCQPDQKIDQMFANIGYIPVRLLFIDKVISPSNKIPVTTTLKKNIYLSFSGNLGTRGQIVLGKFMVETDQSIWPFSQITQEIGHYIQQFHTHTVGIQPTGKDFGKGGSRNHNYIELDIRKSTLIYNVQRFHQKIDDLLSYIGGLFSLIFVVIFFFFGSFNEYRMELMVAEASFSYGEDGKKLREKDMGFLTYFLYSIYDWLKMIGINLKWQKMQKIDQARQEANQQLDMAYIMKKIRYYDWCLSLMMEKSHRLASHLRRPTTLQESIKDRKLVEYYDKVIKNKFSDQQLQRAFEIFDMKSGKSKKKLPIQEYRSIKSMKSEEQPNQQMYPEISNQNLNDHVKDVEEKKQYKFKKKCSCHCDDLIEDQYDSDDEEAQKMLYIEYQNLVKDTSDNANTIKDRIPLYLKSRMLAKIKYEETVKLKQTNIDAGFISLSI